MLEQMDTDNLKEEFDRLVNDLELITRKAQLMRKFNQASRRAANASPDEMTQILADLKNLREQIRHLES